jgi:hypothetical protein
VKHVYPRLQTPMTLRTRTKPHKDNTIPSSISENMKVASPKEQG